MPRKKLFEDDPNWTFETVLLPEGFEAYNKYYYKRLKGKRIVLDSHKAKAYCAYVLIEKDLRNCLIWLNIIKDQLEGDPRYKKQTQNIDNSDNREVFNSLKGLFVAALTIYGKCFTTCEGRRIKLERSNLEESFQETHDRAMSFRNNFAAHSGALKMESSKLVVLLEPKKHKALLPRLAGELLQPDTWSLESTIEFIELAEHAQKWTLSKVDTLHGKIYEDILEKGKDYWYTQK